MESLAPRVPDMTLERSVAYRRQNLTLPSKSKDDPWKELPTG